LRPSRWQRSAVAKKSDYLSPFEPKNFYRSFQILREKYAFNASHLGIYFFSNHRQGSTMRTEYPATFSMNDLQYGDLKSRSIFESRFDDSGEARRCDHLKTRLHVATPPSSRIPRYRWEDRELWFYTEEEEQALDIEIVSRQMMSDQKPRFHLHRIAANDMKWISRVGHKQQINDDWVWLREIDDSVPKHTRFIQVRLALPHVDPPTRFKLSVFARDRDFFSREINCDPLVGNDPPGNAGPSG